jgi:hypothetical protein
VRGDGGRWGSGLRWRPVVCAGGGVGLVGGCASWRASLEGGLADLIGVDLSAATGWAAVGERPRWR